MWFRFEFLFGFAAVVALFHDLIITFGVFNMLGDLNLAGEVTLDVVSALLVILGYSVNDTIIIFDRVRENMRLHPGTPMRELINRSICESLNRTFNTVGTVIMVLVVMLVLGGKGLYDFALVLLIGIIKGTYSSSFVASPLLYDIGNYLKKRSARRSGAQQISPLLKGNQ
jgi:preprotein translocase subunit SecF